MAPAKSVKNFPQRFTGAPAREAWVTVIESGPPAVSRPTAIIATAPGRIVIAETSRDTANYWFSLCINDDVIAKDAEVSI